MNCTECHRRLYPEDPSLPFYAGNGRYLPALCQSCPSFRESQRKQWNQSPQVVVKHITIFDHIPAKPKAKPRPKVLKAIEG